MSTLGSLIAGCCVFLAARWGGCLPETWVMSLEDKFIVLTCAIFIQLCFSKIVFAEELVTMGRTAHNSLGIRSLAIGWKLTAAFMALANLMIIAAHMTGLGWTVTGGGLPQLFFHVTVWVVFAGGVWGSGALA